MTPEEKAAKKEAAALKRKEKLANVSRGTGADAGAALVVFDGVVVPGGVVFLFVFVFVFVLLMVFLMFVVH